LGNYIPTNNEPDINTPSPWLDHIKIKGSNASLITSPLQLGSTILTVVNSILGLPGLLSLIESGRAIQIG